MTLINVKNAVKDEDDDEASKKKFTDKTFDARHILENFNQYEFGLQPINEICLAILKTKDADGFYKCTSSIQL